ncbi:unnamed protein product [Owenia fusiformis]|uniref:Phospholipase B1, membrane-associated n=1 Tax=Owenia fusiformis TaxID=6347 RepID=A0A8J1UM97_OWEFU|nr:unnamed protein product [Owenia fusiformis]
MKTGVFILCVFCANSFVVDSFEKSFLERYQEANDRLQDVLKRDANLQKEWDARQKMWREPINKGAAMLGDEVLAKCGRMKSSVAPDSVHRLLPGDINVVAAVGDSITAANGASATTVFGCLTEYRGRSWSVGGDLSLSQGVSTIPNILRTLNPNLVGYSVGEGGVESSGARLNVAEPGNIAIDMPRQARNLVQRLASRSDVDFQNDWKLITLFIGGNDLCAVCNDRDAKSPENYRNNIKEALDILYADVPRAFVNVVSILDITPLTALAEDLICTVVQAAVCDCGYGEEDILEELRQTQKDYNANMEELIDSGLYNGRDDFTVVFQPFFKDTTPPTKPDGTPDVSYFAPDCFHFSEKGHKQAATTLWNQMFEPVGSKRQAWTQQESIQCSPGSFFATSRNSRKRAALVANGEGSEASTSEMGVSYILLATGLVICVAIVASLGVIYVRRRSRNAPTGLNLPTSSESRVNITDIST